MKVGASMDLKGRRKIYTDFSSIDETNVKKVLIDSLIVHEGNRTEIKFLLDFDKGIQPLMREKTVRPEIDIRSTLNLANEITEFKLGYVWGNPIALVQKSDRLPKGSDANADNSAISMLNDMYYAEEKDSKDQRLARYVEICGIGHQMIDIKRDAEEGDSPFDLITLNPLFTFVVYSSDVYHKPVLGVTYTPRVDGTRTFTCCSSDRVYIINEMCEIVNGEKADGKEKYEFGDRSGEPNPMGEVNIIEFERSFDRTGCFERQIDELNTLNILESDFANDVAQNTQAIWWGNDIQLEEDDNGNPVGVKAGQWILTKTTGSNNKPDIKALVLQYDYSGVLQNIQQKHDYILECAFVPKQSDPGGGSTGTAMSLSSGWSAAEAAACKESLVLKESFQRRNKLALKAIKKSPVPVDEALMKLSANDIEIRFIRQKTFDMSSKVNALSTMLNCMVDPKTAMATIDLFGNLAEAVDDSVENMRKYQENLLKNNSEMKPAERLSSDLSDQTENSPILSEPI